jgi:hypothetical protein
MAASSLASLKDSCSPQEPLWSAHSLQSTAPVSSPATLATEALLCNEELPCSDAPAGSSPVSSKPIRRFTRASRGLDVYSRMMAAQTSITKPAHEQQSDVKGVDQDGLPPQQ